MIQATEIVYTIQDEKGNKSTLTVWIPSSTLLADALEFAQKFGDLIDNVIDGIITRIGLIFSAALTGTMKTVVNPGADVEEGANFIYRSALGFPFRHRFATFMESKITPGSRAVNVADADVVALVNAITDGLTMTSLNVVRPTEHREDDIASLVTAREVFQRSRQ